MPRTQQKESSIDALDRNIIHALQLAPRVGFSRIASVVGASEQTVARRYRRLVADGVIRVIVATGPNRAENAWLLRVQCRPNAGGPMAEALAAMPDVSWVSMVAAGSEIVCVVRARRRAESDELLLRRIPRTAEVLNFSAHASLHAFRSGRSEDWAGYDDLLTAAQQAALLTEVPDVRYEPGHTYRAEDIDDVLLEVLARDGRATLTELAAAAHCSEGRVGRRLDHLQRGGEVRFEVEIAATQLGFGTTAYLWLTVEPAQLAAAGSAIAEHSEVSFAAAVTGTANLMVAVLARSPEDLYRYVTSRVGPIPGVRQAEIAISLRRVKYERTRVTNERLRTVV